MPADGRKSGPHHDLRTGPEERLAEPDVVHDALRVQPEPTIVREDVDAILGGIWDMRESLFRIVFLLGGFDDEEEEADES